METHPLDFLNPHEQEYNRCAHCDVQCEKTYCSTECKKYDTE